MAFPSPIQCSCPLPDRTSVNNPARAPENSAAPGPRSCSSWRPNFVIPTGAAQCEFSLEHAIAVRRGTEIPVDAGSEPRNLEAPRRSGRTLTHSFPARLTQVDM